MKLYFELLKYPVFTMEHVNQYYDNIESARSAVKRLIKSGLAVKIRNNLYTCISGETDAPVANRYQIAGAITSTSYLSHHSAMEYYGISDQIFYEVYVSSNTMFRDFEFDGYTFCYVCSKCNEGVETVKYSGGVRIADGCTEDEKRTRSEDDVVNHNKNLLPFRKSVPFQYSANLKLYIVIAHNEQLPTYSHG